MSKILFSVVILIQSMININYINGENLTLNELSSLFFESDQWVSEINHDIEYVYQIKNSEEKEFIVKLLKEIPDKMKNGIDQIILHLNNNGDIAGITNDGDIELFNFSKYSKVTQKYILYHELAHTWGRYLMNNKVLDYHYTQYQEYVKLDNNYVTKYSKNYIIEKNNYSEDFADSVAQYLINKEKFILKYPNRAKYILQLLDTTGVDLK